MLSIVLLVSNSNNRWPSLAEYYVFVTKKIVELELEDHCEHLPSSHCDFYVSHCYDGCG